MELPCDAEIVMGCFAAYMDTRMPANFRNTSTSPTENSISYQLEDKPFTGVFFVVLPESGKSDKTHQRQSERELSLAHRAHDQQSNMTFAIELPFFLSFFRCVLYICPSLIFPPRTQNYWWDYYFYKAKLLLIKLIHLFAREVLLVKSWKSKKLRQPFKTDMIKVGLVFLICNFFITERLWQINGWGKNSF